jgi:hypothetical protein
MFAPVVVGIGYKNDILNPIAHQTKIYQWRRSQSSDREKPWTIPVDATPSPALLHWSKTSGISPSRVSIYNKYLSQVPTSRGGKQRTRAHEKISRRRSAPGSRASAVTRRSVRGVKPLTAAPKPNSYRTPSLTRPIFGRADRPIPSWNSLRAKPVLFGRSLFLRLDN